MQGNPLQKMKILLESVHLDIIDFLGTHDDEKLKAALLKLNYILEEKMQGV